MPTDALTRLREVMVETQTYGFEKVRREQIALGSAVRTLFERRGIQSVAAEGFKASGVVVSYTGDADIQSSKSSWHWACKPQPVCPCNAMSPQTS